ncbi:MAG: HIT domain-containing protein [Acidimicrobiaceae bacterium]|nr:HIT domain-containing protein [Acidimicrobiaceae bacterium]
MSRTWPADWDDRRAGKDCAMCAQGRPEETPHGVRILAAEWCDAYLQREAALPGYAIVIWRGRHVAEPTELSADEAAGYWSEVLRVGRALEAHYRPAKVNYQMLGNSLPHLHAHIVLRYLDDPAPGRPLDPAAGLRLVPEDELAKDVAALRRSLATPD